MSIYYSKYDLNTYRTTPYFHANVPPDYPVTHVLIKARAFRKLPPRLRELSALAKRWTDRVYPGSFEGIENLYDEEGYELNPETKKRLTDEENDALWDKPDEKTAALVVEDVPKPEGGFADPDTWDEPGPEADEDTSDEGPDLGQLLRDIGSHGSRYVARYYGVPTDQLPKERTAEALAHTILRLRKKEPPPVKAEVVTPPVALAVTQTRVSRPDVTDSLARVLDVLATAIARPPAEVNVTIEAPPPAIVNVAAPPPAEVNVTVEAPKHGQEVTTREVVRDQEGLIIKTVETTESKPPPEDKTK